MDVEIEKPHVHHHPRLGIPWYDLAIPLAALFVSFVSIFIAWHHGQVMKELVHQNEKLSKPIRCRISTFTPAMSRTIIARLNSD